MFAAGTIVNDSFRAGSLNILTMLVILAPAKGSGKKKEKSEQAPAESEA